MSVCFCARPPGQARSADLREGAAKPERGLAGYLMGINGRQDGRGNTCVHEGAVRRLLVHFDAASVPFWLGPVGYITSPSADVAV